MAAFYHHHRPEQVCFIPEGKPINLPLSNKVPRPSAMLWPGNCFISGIRVLLVEARQSVVKQVNATMIKTYYEIGRRIVEQEQQGKEVANYGDYILVRLSESLSGSFGKGFSKRNLELMRQFYLTYRIAKSPISQSLSWTHYIRLMRISDPDERRFYEIEAANNNWSVRELNRQFDSALYQRLALSRDKEAIKELAIKGQTIEKPEDILKDPYVLEFTGLPELPQYTVFMIIVSHSLLWKREHSVLRLHFKR